MVSLAENVSVTTQNRAEFDRLLDEALAFDCDKYPVKANEANPSWADYIFDGRVKAVRTMEKDGEPVATMVVFEVMKVYKGTSILMIAIVLTTILIMAFPQIALWLPATMR